MNLKAVKFSSLSLLVFFGLIGSAPLISASEVSYVFNARLLGGQYFFENQESELSGDAGIVFSPAVKLGDRWSIVPIINSSWRGTKSVKDLVGGGTLFQQTQDHMGSAKAVYQFSEKLQFKGGGGYHLQLLKETKDESWGKGLFDYEKPWLNFEMERTLSRDSAIRLGYDYFWIDFRNYTSLESQQRDLGRENVGAKTLDTQNHAPYLSWRSAFGFFGQTAKYDLTYYHTLRSFTDQKVVLPTGELSTDKRSDTNMIATANMTLPYFFTDRLKLLQDYRLAASVLSSNQSNYDAAKTRFNDNYYAYKEYTVGLNNSFLLGTLPWIVSGGFTYVRRAYDSRLTQNDGGDYGSEKIGVNEYYANLGVTYPVNKNFRVQALGNFGWSRSNMKYERTYQYHYETFSYLLGVIYDY